MTWIKHDFSISVIGLDLSGDDNIIRFPFNMMTLRIGCQVCVAVINTCTRGYDRLKALHLYSFLDHQRIGMQPNICTIIKYNSLLIEITIIFCAFPNFYIPNGIVLCWTKEFLN